MTRYTALLRTHWTLANYAWIGFALAVLGAMLLPLVLPDTALGLSATSDAVARMGRSTAVAGGIIAFLAFGAGATAGIFLPSADPAANRLYRMILPIARWQMALLEFGAGSTFIAIMALWLLVCGGAFAAFGPIPEGMHAYPLALALRFAATALLVQSFFLSLNRATERTQIRGAIVVFGLIGLAIILTLFGFGWLIERALTLLFTSGGPLRILIGSWQLVDF
jgi:hypothetical protein